MILMWWMGAISCSWHSCVMGMSLRRRNSTDCRSSCFLVESMMIEGENSDENGANGY